MIPPLIVEQALQRGIHFIAITDHNATANIEAVQKAARGTDLTVLPGMELQTREEVHLLCLFDTLEQAQELQHWVDRNLPSLKNNTEFFGEQFVVDETGDFICREERLLSTSVDASLNEAWEVVNRAGGLLIPAHVNRKAFGLIPMLGLVPTDIPLEALEISRHMGLAEVPAKLPQAAGYPLIQNGDVHFLEDFLGSTVWYIERPSISELRLALKGEAGRSFAVKL